MRRSNSSAAGGQHKTRRNITVYIAATIAGGYSGRVLSGIITDLFDWQAAFLFWAIAALLATLLTTRLASDPRLRLGRVRLAEIRALARRPVYAEGLASAFLLFFVFAAVLNFLPFHMRDNDPQISQSEIALVYTGYLVGAVISLGSLRLIAALGGERRTLVAGSLVYLAGTALFALPGNTAAYLSMLVFAAGMFTLHSVLSAFLNHLETERKGLVNGLYVSAYYTGGALGSYLPGFLYLGWGWNAFVTALMLLLGILTALSLALRQQDHDATVSVYRRVQRLVDLLLGTLPLGKALLFRKLRVSGSKSKAMQLEPLLHACQAVYPRLASDL